MKAVFRGHTTLVILLLLLVTQYSFGQTRLKVLNESLKPLNGANVENLSDGSISITDKQGVVELDVSATQRFRISHVGYDSKEIILVPSEMPVVILSVAVQKLTEARVEGFLSNASLDRQAGAVSLLSPAELNRFNPVSLVNAVNTLPGIRFEERAGGSYRVSIRGSSIRSPFGVRNVKVYWNGIPFTEPGGNTFLNLLDLQNVGNVEILKGPSGSIYGAGTGGVMKIKSTSLSNTANKVVFGGLVGSFGLQKYHAAINSFTEKSSITFKYANQSSDGYRDHNALQREVLELDMAFFTDDKRTITSNFLYSDLFYEIPGGLNQQQLLANRRQARPGSEAQNASISNALYLFKVGQEYQFSEGFNNETNIYGTFNQFTNPFNLDFKRDNQQVFGGRSVFELSMDKTDIVMGMEFQNSFFDGKNFGNVGGQADTIRFADEVNTAAKSVFLQTNVELKDGFSINGGLSLNALKYDINRLVDGFTNTPRRVVKRFETVWSPRLAVTKRFNKNLSAHVSVSRGFSPPTTTEVRTNEGTLSLALEPEKGTNYELNLRGNLSENISFDITGFHFQLEETIVSNPNTQGVVLFNNAGETSQSGAEVQLEADLMEGETSFTKDLLFGLSYTYHDFEFRNYIKRGNEFSGNALPGTAPSTFNGRIDWFLNNGLKVNFTYHYVDAIPLNDANTVSSDAYHLLSSRLGYTKEGNKMDWEMFFGIENLTNNTFSLGNDLNAFGGRFFQPAAGTNYYFGLKVKFDYK